MAKFTPDMPFKHNDRVVIIKGRQFGTVGKVCSTRGNGQFKCSVIPTRPTDPVSTVFEKYSDRLRLDIEPKPGKPVMVTTSSLRKGEAPFAKGDIGVISQVTKRNVLVWIGGSKSAIPSTVPRTGVVVLTDAEYQAAIVGQLFAKQSRKAKPLNNSLIAQA